VRVREKDGGRTCGFRFKRESARLGDYVARVFGRCMGSLCELPLRFQEGVSRCFPATMLNDANWSSGVLRNAPQVILFSGATLEASGMKAGDAVFIGARPLPLAGIRPQGAYSHVSLGAAISPDELKAAGGWVCKGRAS
jgi:hypothetical protein